MSKNSIFKNTFYAFLLQFTNMLYPLITAPYVSRVIGPDGLGKVDFSTSVVGWFTIIATFGTTTYGLREVAKCRDSKADLSQFFSEMLVIKITATIVAVAIYLPCIIFVQRFSKEYLLFLIQGTILLLNIFSIDWFFQGMEDYKYITTRSVLLKAISLAALFILVKAKGDYLIYAGISIFALSFSNVLNYVYSMRYVRITWKEINIKRHLKPLKVFFLSAMVISIYALLDQVLLGFMKSDRDVALYARAKMLLAAGIVLSSTISSVIMPRLNNYFVNDRERYTNLLRMSADIMLMVSVPVAAGIIVLAETAMLLFGGQEFANAGTALVVVAPLSVIVPIGIWNYQQRSLPYGYERIGLYGQIAMAVVSVIFNIILIPLMGYVGAAVSYLIAETTGDIIGFIYMHKKDGFRMFTLQQTKYFLAAGVMASLIMMIQEQLPPSWLSLLLCMFIGTLSYFTLLFIMHDKILLWAIEIAGGKLRKGGSN